MDCFVEGLGRKGSEGIVDEFVKLAATAGVTEMTKLIINTYLKPKLQNIKLRNDFIFEGKLEEYLNKSYYKYLYMNTIVFKNQQKTIDDLYIPLTVAKCSIKNRKSVDVNIIIDEFPDSFIPRYKKVLLIDNAGMGKSTIIKYLYQRVIKENKGIPILIELRKLNKETSIIDFIMNEMNGIRESFNKEDVIEVIEEGDFIFFFDGYDEIAEDSKSKVTEELEKFISDARDNMFIISSRDENSLSCFGQFQRFDIKPLKKEEAYNLIIKYDDDGELSKQLIQKLENEDNLKIIREFLKNPLMVSLLYKAFEYKETIPYKKNIFYRQVYNALFDEHDMTKGGSYVHPKKSKLDIDDFCKILRALGFLTLSKGISYSKEELIQSIENAKRLTHGIAFKENDFISDIIHNVPLFIKESNEYKWMHKSFQEYFAAEYICVDAKEKGNKYLLEMINQDKIDKYYNVLDFCYDIDYKGFAKIIIYPIIKQFIDYYNNSYKDKKYKDYDPEVLDIRKNMNFAYNEIYIKFFNTNELENKIQDKFDSNNKFTIAFQGWNKYNLKKGRCSISSNSYFEIAIGFYNKDKDLEVLMNLLSSKNSPIINKANCKNRLEDVCNFVTNTQNKEYILNIKNQDIPNTRDDFYLFNNILMNYGFSHRGNGNQKYIFNYDECVKLKNEIEEESNFEEDIFL